MVAPNNIFQDYYLIGLDARLEVHGQWCVHVNAKGQQQWVVLQFFDRPEDTRLGGEIIQVSSNDPYLVGNVHHFKTRPTRLKSRNPRVAKQGSYFWVDGWPYKADDVKISNRGLIRISLSREKCCNERFEGWDEFVGLLTCPQDAVSLGCIQEIETIFDESHDTEGFLDGVRRDSNGDLLLDIINLPDI